MNKEAEKPLIKNTLVEKMFLRIGNDAEVTQFVTLAKDSTARATAYASRKVEPIFEALVRERERQVGTIEGLKTVVYRKGMK